MTEDVIREAGSTLASKSVAQLEADIHGASLLPFLGEQREAVVRCIQDAIYATMLFMHQVHVEGHDTTAIFRVMDPDAQEKRILYGQCVQCGAPFYHPQAAEPWIIGAVTVFFCRSCSDKKRERVKR